MIDQPPTKAQEDAIIAREYARRMQCPSRRTSGSTPSCGLVEIELGFPAGMSISTCDKCWQAGGPDSQGGADVRRSMIERTVEHLVARPAGRLPSKPVMLTIARRHLTKDKAETYLTDNALYLGERGANEIAAEFPTAAVKMRAALEVATARQLWDARPAAERWSEVRPFWERAASLIAAIGGGRLNGNDPDDDRRYVLRQFSCNGGGGNEPCPARRKSKVEGEYYCGECGCGDTALARLDNKLTYRNLPCPRAMPGFTNELPLESERATPAAAHA